MCFIDPRMSKLNIHVKRTVHFAHGYRKMGGREVEDKKNVCKVSCFITSLMLKIGYQEIKNVYSYSRFTVRLEKKIKMVYSYSRILQSNRNHRVKYLQFFGQVVSGRVVQC